MFIVAQEGETYARLRFNIGPGGSLEIPVAVDFSRDFSASDQIAWKSEYDQCVWSPSPPPLAPNDTWPAGTPHLGQGLLDDDWEDFFRWPDEEIEAEDRTMERPPSKPFAEVIHA